MTNKRNVTLVETWTQGEDSYYGTEVKTGKTHKNLTLAQAQKLIVDHPRKNYDIYVDGKRVMLWSGAGGPFRIEYAQEPKPKPAPKKTAKKTTKKTPKPKPAPKAQKPMSSQAAAWLESVATESPSEATRKKAEKMLEDTADAPLRPPTGSGLQLQSSFGGGGGQTYFKDSSPKKKGKKTGKKTSKKKEKKGSGSLAAFGVMPEGQKTLDEMAAELMR